MQGSVKISIAKTKKYGNVGSFSISQLNLGLQATITDNGIVFKLQDPQYLIIELNGRQELVLMVDPLENGQEAVDINDPSVRLITSKIYPADNTGDSYATVSIQSAINDVTSAGGGVAYIPASIYKTGNLVLKSNAH
jgi:hypothetical protein